MRNAFGTDLADRSRRTSGHVRLVAGMLMGFAAFAGAGGLARGSRPEVPGPDVPDMQKTAPRATIYPALGCPGYVYSTNDFQVTVDGRQAPVRDYRPFGNSLEDRDRNYHVVHVGVGPEPVRVTVDAREPVETFSISPKAYGIAGEADARVLAFTLDRPRYLAIRVNAKNMLFILADPIETNRPASSGVDPASGRDVFNVSSAPYRVDATSSRLATQALQRAIEDAANASGGGIVYVPEGLYATHRLTLRSHVWLYLEPGAMLTPDPVRGNWWTGWEPDHILTVTNTVGTKIYGRGVIDCRNEAMSLQHKPEDKFRMRLRPMKIAKVVDFTLEGVTGAESGEWTFSVEGGERIALRNVKVLNEKKLGTNDGIDICGGTDVVVEHCFVTTMDDAFCVKGMRGAVRNVRFHDNVADTTKSAFKVGMQGMDEVQGVSVSEHHVIRCYKGFDFSHYYGSAAWRDIRFTDCRVEQVHGKAGNPVRGAGTPIRLLIDRQTTFGYPKGVGPIDGVSFKRIQFDDPGPNVIALKGYDATNGVRDVAFDDVVLGGRKLTADDSRLQLHEHVEGVTVDGAPVRAGGSPEETRP